MSVRMTLSVSWVDETTILRHCSRLWYGYIWLICLGVFVFSIKYW